MCSTAQPVPPNAGEHMPIRPLLPAYDDHLPNRPAAQAPLSPPVPPPHMPSPCPGIPPPLTPCKLRPGAPPAIPPAPLHSTCTCQVPKWPNNAYGDKHPVEQVKEIKHTKHWHDIIQEPGPSRQIPDEPASQIPGNFPNTSALPAPIPASAEFDSKADIKQLCYEGGAGLATFLMSKAILYKADSAESKPLCKWTYKNIQMLPAAAQEGWKATCRHKLEMLCEHKVYELVNPPKGWKVIPNQWVFDVKTDGRKCAQLVAKSFSQVKEIDFDQIFSLVVRFETVHLMLALSALEN